MTEAVTLVELLSRRARERPDAPAYLFLADDGGEAEAVTYAGLHERACAVAAGIQHACRAGDRVLLLYPPGLEYVAAFFGCVYAGAVAVPVYPPRANRTSERVAAVVSDARPSLALTTSAVRARLGPTAERLPGLDSLGWLCTDEVGADSAGSWRPPRADAESLAFLQYTSGSTSAPKGVMVTHANLLHNQRAIRDAFGQTEDSVVVGWLPLYHDMGLIGNVLQPLYVGARCVLMSPAAFLRRPASWLEAVTAYRATTSGGPNFAYDLCVRKVGEEERARLDLGSWAVAFNGAEPVRAETMERFAAAFAPCGFRREAFQPCYGLAEATLLVAGAKPDAGAPVVKHFAAEELEKGRVAEAAAEGEGARALVGCGKPAAGQRVVVVRPDSRVACGENEVGEIWVAGPGVARGYWGRPEETEQTFGARLVGDGDGGPYLRTGDLGFVAGGQLFVTGRLKDLIIIRGRNLYPQDIELTVERSHTALRAGCGAAFSCDLDGEERLVVVQELERRAPAAADEVFEEIRRALADEHQVQPHAVVLLKPGTVPKTSSGKIQRRACRSLFLRRGLEAVAEWSAPVGGQDAGPPKQGREDIAPGGAWRERDVAEWLRTEVAARLKVDEETVDVNRPLASYGLDSLGAVELSHRIETALGVAVPMASLLEDASIAGLAALAVRKRDARDGGQRVDGRAPAADESAREFEEHAPPRGQFEEHALSREQQSLWFLHQLAPSSAAYNLSFAARVVSALDAGRLRRALFALVERHPALRTTFPARDGAPVQRVHRTAEVWFREEDASALDETALRRRLDEEAGRPFDLERGPLLRVSLFKRAAGDYVLLLSLHHIISDGWSLALVVRELGALYEAAAGRAAPTPARLARGYTDYVRRQERLLDGPEAERLLSYWRGALGGDLPALNLPTDRPRPPAQSFRGSSLYFEFDRELSRRVRAVGLAHGATVYMTLLAAFQALLYRYAGQEDFAVGSSSAARGGAEWADAVGFFVNPLAMRADLSGDPTFLALLGRVRETVLGAFAHQDVPFALLVEQLQPARSGSAPPFFQVMFTMQNPPPRGAQELAAFALGAEGARLNMGCLGLESLALARRAAQFDLSLLMAEVEGRLAGSLEYNTDLFDAPTAERMLAHFRNLVAGVVADPARPLSRVSLLTEDERRQLLEEWNDTREGEAPRRCFHQLFEAQARQTPEAAAVFAGAERVSYGELNKSANRLARRLRARGVGPDQPVALYVSRSPRMLVGLLAVLKAGGAYLPIDPSNPPERVAFMLGDARSPLVLTEEQLASRLPAGGPPVFRLDADGDEAADESAEDFDGGARDENLAYVIYTSGSTGKPKGVMVTHGGLANYLDWCVRAYAVADGERAPVHSSIGFDLTVTGLLAPLAAGRAVELIDEGRGVEALAEALGGPARYSLVKITPAHLEALARLMLDRGRAPRAGAFVIGGEALFARDLEAWRRLAPDVRLVNEYGPTETVVGCCVHEVGADDPADGAVPIGRPIANTEIYLLDRGFQLVPPGVVGELYVGGRGLARGYLGRPGLTAARFIPHPFSRLPGARLYKTGDAARRLADGRLEYLGRFDDQVKVRGYRIEPGEIEAVVNSHPSVRQAVVVVRDDAAGGKRLVAYVVAREAAETAAREDSGRRDEAGRDEAERLVAELKDHLARRLPDYMIPAAFVVLEELPLNANGKVDRRRLPAPRPALTAARGEDSAPRTPTEEALAKIWADTLGLERVGREDNFFELGGHSLLATQIVSRVRDRFHVELPLHSLFDKPTVAGVSAAIEQARASGEQAQTPAVVRVARSARRVRLSPHGVVAGGGGDEQPSGD